MDPSRRDALRRIGTATAVLAGAAALGKLTWDPGGSGAAHGVAGGLAQIHRPPPDPFKQA